ncbi:MAG: alpha-glucosidase [Clostridia bacterium]|nr:alpha-glucosidase [Clostridia bacterium]
MGFTEQEKRDMIVYQIYPRSFLDTNGDGVGDIRGIIEKIPYIKSLGVNAVWLSPIYQSPNADYGYDISDYLSINPEYGYMADFDEMLQIMHANGIKLIMDLVLNHTSDKHRWFEQCKTNSDYRNYYFWKDGKGNNPPNNWSSFFTGSAWEYDKSLDSWYLHLFDKGQPDLNYGNPRVVDEIEKIMTFWLEKGVDGFRCDVITIISKKEGLPDGRKRLALTGREHYLDYEDVFPLLKKFKKDVFDKYDAFTVGESVFITPKTALKYIGEDKSLDCVFAFDHMGADNRMGVKQLVCKFDLRKLKKAISRWQTSLYGKALNTIYFENHDQPRIVGRYCSDKLYVEKGAKMIAVLEFSLTGIPFLYQGQELGSTSARMSNLEDYRDVESKRMYELLRNKLHMSHKKAMSRIAYSSRDNARTPMQWNYTKNAGFSTADETWLAVNPNYSDINVERQENLRDSVLRFYRDMIALRKQTAALSCGKYEELFSGSKELFAFTKSLDDQLLLVMCNFSAGVTKVSLPSRFDGKLRTPLIGNYPNITCGSAAFCLRPYEAVVFRIEEMPESKRKSNDEIVKILLAEKKKAEKVRRKDKENR